MFDVGNWRGSGAIAALGNGSWQHFHIGNIRKAARATFNVSRPASAPPSHSIAGGLLQDVQMHVLEASIAIPDLDGALYNADNGNKPAKVDFNYIAGV